MSLDQLTDEELVILVRDKDKDKYAEIIRRYQTKLAHYLRKFVKDQAEQEDVLQEVFIKTYRNLFAFDVEKKFSSWIYRIAHNEAINHIKKNKYNISLDEHELQIIDDKINLDAKVDLSFAKIKIEAALEQMSDRYREPLMLYFFEQKTYDEISDILHIPRNTVGVLIMRAKSIIKELLEK